MVRIEELSDSGSDGSGSPPHGSPALADLDPNVTRPPPREILADNPFAGEPVDFSGAPILMGTTAFASLPEHKNIMITGGAGFIGSWIVRHFTTTYEEDYNIVVFDVLDTPASLENFRCLVDCKNFKFVRGDITDSKAVQKCMEENKIDSVIHFAAQSHVDLSFGNSYSFTSVNVMGTHVMLECAKRQKVKRFVHVSTDEVYGEIHGDHPGVLETHILAPTNPYAASKAAAEMLVNSYSMSFQLPCIIVRSNNVYGPAQYPEKIIPKFALSLHVGKKLFLHGDGSNTRKYLYGQDAADAFDTIFHKGEIGEIYNVGSADEIRNVDVCKKVLDLFGLNTISDYTKIVEHSKDRPFNDSRYAVNGDKLKALGWRQKVPFEEGLVKTVYWYTKYGFDWWGQDVTACCTAFPGSDTPVVDTHNKQWESLKMENLRVNATSSARKYTNNGHHDEETAKHRIVYTGEGTPNGIDLVRD